MTDQEFDTFLQGAVAELRTKQGYLEREFGLGHYQKFFVDYEREEIQFSADGLASLVFSITPVGSYVPEKQSWCWSWSNKSLPESVRKKAAALQQLHEMTGLDVFKNPAASIDETMAWEFVALSCKVLGAMGAYSMPQRHLRAFVLLDGVKRNA